MKFYSNKLLMGGLASMAFFALAGNASAVVIAGYDFSSASVTNTNKFNATAANIASAQPGVEASPFTTAGTSSNSQTSISISAATNTAYIQGSYTPTIANIYTGARYFTFSVTLTSGYNLGSLVFQYGGTNLTSSASTTAFGAQIQIGDGAFANLPVTSGATIAANTSTYTETGTYNADLSAYQNITGNVTVRIFAGDNSSDNGVSARIKSVALNADAIPEPAAAVSLAAGLAVFALRRRRA
jgi:hypothetical protein